MVAAVTAAVLPAPGIAGTPDAHRTVLQQVIVQAAPNALAKAEAAVTAVGGKVARQLHIVNGFAASLPAGAHLGPADGVRAVTPDRAMHLQAATYAPATDPGAPLALATTLGAGSYYQNGFSARASVSPSSTRASCPRTGCATTSTTVPTSPPRRATRRCATSTRTATARSWPGSSPGEPTQPSGRTATWTTTSALRPRRTWSASRSPTRRATRPSRPSSPRSTGRHSTWPTPTSTSASSTSRSARPTPGTSTTRSRLPSSGRGSSASPWSRSGQRGAPARSTCRPPTRTTSPSVRWTTRTRRRGRRRGRVLQQHGSTTRNPDLVAPGHPPGQPARHRQLHRQQLRLDGGGQRRAVPRQRHLPGGRHHLGRAALVISQHPGIRPDQVSGILSGTARSLPGSTWATAGPGELNLGGAYGAAVPNSSSTGTHANGYDAFATALWGGSWNSSNVWQSEAATLLSAGHGAQASSQESGSVPAGERLRRRPEQPVGEHARRQPVAHGRPRQQRTRSAPSS